MHLQEFFDYKNQLMKDILTTESIVRLIDDNVAMENAKSLAYTKVFPYEYIPDTIQEGHTFVCFDVDIRRSINKMILMPVIYVWAFTHKSKMRLPNGEGVRIDRLCSAICEKINGSRYYGLGELEINSVDRFAPMNDFQGKCLTFYARDIGRQYNPNNPTPVNRRDGV